MIDRFGNQPTEVKSVLLDVQWNCPRHESIHDKHPHHCLQLWLNQPRKFFELTKQTLEFWSPKTEVFFTWCSAFLGGEDFPVSISRIHTHSTSKKNVQKIWRLTWLNESILFKAALCFWEGDIYLRANEKTYPTFGKTEHHLVEGIRNFQVGHYQWHK